MKGPSPERYSSPRPTDIFGTSSCRMVANPSNPKIQLIYEVWPEYKYISNV